MTTSVSGEKLRRVSVDNATEEEERRRSSASVTSPSTHARRPSRLSSSAGIFDLDDDGIEPGSTDSKAGRDRFSSHDSSQHGSVSSRSSRNLFDVQEEDVVATRSDLSEHHFGKLAF